MDMLDGTGNAFSPVPFHNVFPDDVPQGAEEFEVDFDPDTGESDGVGAGTSSTMPDSGDEVRVCAGSVDER